MLEIITHFFSRHIEISTLDDNNDEKIRVDSAALLMEMLHAEADCAQEKQHLVMILLENRFNLSEQQALELMAIAEQKRIHATDYFEFTHLINESFTREQKIQLIEALWKIAFLDNHLEFDEEYLIDKVARLLIIPHIEVLKAKNRVNG